MWVGWADEWSPVICWVHDWVRLSDTELKSKGLYFRLLYLLWLCHGVDSLPICSWSRNLLLDKREDWGFYLAQPFPSWFPSSAAILCWSFTSSHGSGTRPPLQWFFQSLNKEREKTVLLLTSGEFGWHSYVTPMCPLVWAPSLCWQMNVVVCRCWSATGEVKIVLVLLQKCQLFSEKLTRELSDSRAVLTESSLGLVLSTECGCDCSEQFQCKIFYWIVQLKHAGKGMFSPTPEVIPGREWFSKLQWGLFCWLFHFY